VFLEPQRCLEPIFELVGCPVLQLPFYIVHYPCELFFIEFALEANPVDHGADVEVVALDGAMGDVGDGLDGVGVLPASEMQSEHKDGC
jgi:hypothetical protein